MLALDGFSGQSVVEMLLFKKNNIISNAGILLLRATLGAASIREKYRVKNISEFIFYPDKKLFLCH